MRFLTLTLLMLFYTTGCELTGTGTGNPAKDANTGIDESEVILPGPETETDYPLVYHVCEKLVSCNTDLIEADCLYSVGRLSNVNEALGLPTDAYSRFKFIYDDYNDGFLAMNETAHNQCISEIQALTCGDQTVIDAYNSGATAPFESLTNIFTPICADIF